MKQHELRKIIKIDKDVYCDQYCEGLLLNVDNEDILKYTDDFTLDGNDGICTYFKKLDNSNIEDCKIYYDGWMPVMYGPHFYRCKACNEYCNNCNEIKGE